jgi:hypothetical protein
LMSKVSNLFPKKKKRKYIQSGQKLEIWSFILMVNI